MNFAGLGVRRTLGNRGVLLRLENDDGTLLNIRNSADAEGASDGYDLGHFDNGVFGISTRGSGQREFRMTPGGDVTIVGELTADGMLLTSSREAKEGFEPVDGEEILERLVELPLGSWSFKEDETGARHLGPMAEDFHAAFDLGSADARHIGVTDSLGVGFAAIQGLDRRLEREMESLAVLRKRVASLEAQREQLRSELEELKALVRSSR